MEYRLQAAGFLLKALGENISRQKAIFLATLRSHP